MSSPTPYLLAVQIGAKLLCCEGALLESQGRHADAMEKYYDTVAYGQAIGTHMSLMGRLIGVAVEGVAYRRMEMCLAASRLTERDLADAIVRIWEFERRPPTMGPAFVSEHLSFRNTVQESRISDMGLGIQNWSERAMSVYMAVNKNQIIRNNERIMLGMAAAVEGNDPGFDIDAAIAETDLINRFGMPNFLNAGIRRDVLRARGRGTLILAAVLLHQKRHGVYPESLTDLEDLLGVLPEDPFSETGYAYTRTPGGFLLYSLGPDKADSGGAPIYDPTNGALSNGDVRIGRW